MENLIKEGVPIRMVKFMKASGERVSHTVSVLKFGLMEGNTRETGN